MTDVTGGPVPHMRHRLGNHKTRLTGNALSGVFLLSLLKLSHGVPSILHPRRFFPLRCHRAAPNHFHIPPVSSRHRLCQGPRPVWQCRSGKQSRDRGVFLHQSVEGKSSGFWRVWMTSDSRRLTSLDYGRIAPSKPPPGTATAATADTLTALPFWIKAPTARSSSSPVGLVAWLFTQSVRHQKVIRGSSAAH